MDGFVPTSAAGEFVYLTDREREAIHRTVLDTARGRPVFPCTWDPSPATTAYLTDAAAAQGAAGVILPPPLYYSLDEDTIRAWYASMAVNRKLPLFAHHDPRHNGTGLTPSLYGDLRREGLIAGLFDEGEDMFRIDRIARSDPGVVYAAGDVVLQRAAGIPGLQGFVSTLGNAWPAFCLRLARGEGQLREAMLDRVHRVRRAGGIAALKSLLRMGCRAPLVEPADARLVGLPPSEAP